MTTLFCQSTHFKLLECTSSGRILIRVLFCTRILSPVLHIPKLSVTELRTKSTAYGTKTVKNVLLSRAGEAFKISNDIPKLKYQSTIVDSLFRPQRSSRVTSWIRMRCLHGATYKTAMERNWKYRTLRNISLHLTRETT